MNFERNQKREGKIKENGKWHRDQILFGLQWEYNCTKQGKP